MRHFVVQALRRWRMILIVCFFAYRTAQGDWRQSWLLSTALALALLGVLMNLTVILANGGMPAHVRSDEIPDDQRGDYHPATHLTRLAFLADWIPLGDFMISPGDILLAGAIAAVGLDWVL